MSDTPRTDEQINGKPCTRFEILAGDSLRNAAVPSEFARQLERELNAAQDRIEELEREIDRLNMRILSLEVAGQNVVYQATEMWKRGAIKEWLDLVRKEEDKP